MSMDVYGNLTLVAKEKQEKPIKEEMFERVKRFKERVASIPSDRFDDHFQNLLQDYTELHRYDYEEDETMNLKINNKNALNIIDIKDLWLAENVGPKDGYPFKEIFEKNAIKIYDENIPSEEPPYITMEGEKDSFHLGYDNYGHFLYLMKIEDFNKNIAEINENGYFYHDFGRLFVLDEETVSEWFNNTYNELLKQFKESHIDCKGIIKYSSEEIEAFQKLYDKWSKMTYKDYDFYVAFEGHIS